MGVKMGMPVAWRCNIHRGMVFLSGKKCGECQWDLETARHLVVFAGFNPTSERDGNNWKHHRHVRRVSENISLSKQPTS